MRCTSTVVEHLAAFILTRRRVSAAVQHSANVIGDIACRGGKLLHRYGVPLKTVLVTLLK